MLQNIGRRIIGVVYHPVGVHVVEVILEVGQEQGTHAHSIDEHILGALNVEETDIDAEADEPIRTLDLVRTHILRQKQLAAEMCIRDRLWRGRPPEPMNGPDCMFLFKWQYPECG